MPNQPKGSTHAQNHDFALPALAQNTKPVAADQKQCTDQFKAADINNDGVLDRTEIGNAKQTLPASLSNKDRVTRTEFMAVCSKTPLSA